MFHFYLPLGIIFLFIAYVLIYKGYKGIKEESQSSSTHDNLEYVYRKLTDTVCPALIHIRKKLAEDPENGNIDDYIHREASGDVVQCPALTKEQLFMMDPNTGEQMVRTIHFLDKNMETILDKKMDDLYTDSYIETSTVPSIDPIALEQFKETIYKDRLVSLYTAIHSESDISKKLNRIQYLYTEIVGIENE